MTPSTGTAPTGGRRRGVVAVVVVVVGMVLAVLVVPRVLSGLPAPWPGVIAVVVMLAVLVAVGVPYARAVSRERAAEQAAVDAERPAWAAERGWTFTPGPGAPAPALVPLVLPRVARPEQERDTLAGRVAGREVLVATVAAKVPQRAGGAAVLDLQVEAVSVTTRRRLAAAAVTAGRWPEARWRAPAVVENVAESLDLPGTPAGLRWRLDVGAEAFLPAVVPALAQLVGTRDAVVVSPDRVTVYSLEGRRRADGERRLALALAVADAAEGALGGPVV